MAGTFIIGEKKTRPGVYQRRYKTGSVVAGARNGIGLGLIRANWGPLNTVVDSPPTPTSTGFSAAATPRA